MQKLVFENSNGVTVDLTDFEKYGITDWSGLSECSMDIQSQQVPFNDGSIFLDALLQDRTLSFTVAVNDGGDLQKRYELKRELISILNPKLGEGYLYYTNDFLSRKIKCIPEVPTFPTKNMDNAGTLKASISFTACNPYWEDEEKNNVTFINGQTTIIENKGDAPTNLDLDIIGFNYTNPKLFNFTNGNKLKINGTFENPMKVSTQFGNKKAVVEELQFKWQGVGHFNGFSDGKDFAILMGYPNVKLFKDLTLENSIKGTFVAIAYNPSQDVYCGITLDKIYLSDDLINWNVVDYEIPSDASMRNVRCVDRYNFVIVGSDMSPIRSYDGKTWTKIDSSSDDYSFTDVISTYGTTTGRDSYTFYFGSSSNLYYSWQFGTFVDSGIKASKALFCKKWEVVYFMTTQGVYTLNLKSLFEIKLNSAIPSGSIMSYSQDNGILLIYDNRGNSYMNYSIDGEYFSQEDLSQVLKPLTVTSIYYSVKIKKFIAVGGTVTTSETFVSSDGLNWRNLFNLYKQTYLDIGQNYIIGKKYFCVYGKYLYCKNENGEWEVIFENTVNAKNLKCITYSGELNLYLILTQGGFFTSSNLSDYSYTAYTGLVADDEKAYCEWFDNLHKFVIIRLSYCLESSNGTDWTYHNFTGETLPTKSAIKCKYSEKQNRIVILCYDGTIYESDNTFENWTSYTGLVRTGVNATDLLFCEEQETFIATSGAGRRGFSSSNNSWYISVQDTSIFFAGVVYSKKYKRYFYFDSVNGKIYINKNIYLLTEIQETDDVLENGFYDENTQNVVIQGASFWIDEIVESNNVISNVTTDSDMNFRLEVGKNEILFIEDDGSDGELTLSYYEKYIGV